MADTRAPKSCVVPGKDASNIQTSTNTAGDVKSQETRKQRLEVEKARAAKRNLEKDNVKKQIMEACSDGMKLGDSKKIEDLPAIPNLCKLLKKLAELSEINVDCDVMQGPEDFPCLLKLLKKHRYSYCNLTECCEILNKILDISGPIYTTQSQAEILKELSDLWTTKASYNDAIKKAEQLEQLAIALGDKKLAGEAYYLHLTPLYLKGSIEDAKLVLEKCVRCSEESGDELTIGYSKLATAKLYYMEQKYELALEEEEKVLEIAKRLNNKIAECEATLHMATIYCNLFKIQEALNLFSKGLKMAMDLGYHKKVMETKVNQSSLFSLMGEYRRSYHIGKEIVQNLSLYEDKGFVYTVLCNVSVDALILNKDEEALKLAQQSLVVAEDIGAGEPIALAHGNIGLAQEKLQDFEGAVKSYYKCLEFGEKIKDMRIINNSYCNLGRALEGKGNKEKAKEYYHKALNTPQPPSSHWCDTEHFRFSPDYLLGKIAVEENDYETAKAYFQEVVNRCEKFRKSVQDTPLKICFNDTQKKPFQYLQHVLLKEKADADALLVGEMGRGRDFYDKVIKEDQSKQLNTATALLELAKTNKQAILFLSKLDVVQEMQMWFISPNGEITSFGKKLHEWEKPLEYLGIVFGRGIKDEAQNQQPTKNVAEDIISLHSYATEVVHNSESCNASTTSLESSHPIEIRGIKNNVLNDDDIEYESEDDDIEFEEGSGTNCYQSRATSNSGKGTVNQTYPATRGPSKTPNFSRLIDELSKLIVEPIEDKLENLVTETDPKPQLLIIPQGETFNIPYSTLRLSNGEPLCSLVAPREAFSFHSYSYSMALQEEMSQVTQMKDTLIVGNPTEDLPFAEKEAKMIAEKVGVSPLLRYSATRSEVLRRISQAAIIHFACHGTTDGRSLQLAPERINNNGEKAGLTYLTVEDLSNVTLSANMVVLSACHTAQGKISSEGVLGLARAFLMAGAKSVITSLWAVDDNAAETLMLKFYNNLYNEPVVNALATTMCEMKRENFRVSQWGCFKVLGANIRVFADDV
ncbi:tetratricopeptide repeat protein 28-like [Dendronephthya gigantea]|uniref:tetratricopeptide repeat protein 28-like n=1 Tax=Dendronephthya gigantea TaxID=151771 RepID=UPI00106C9B4F|nr:tetratricopeptide repeat protein 28-like [Dendronephthya gigantea]